MSDAINIPQAPSGSPDFIGDPGSVWDQRFAERPWSDVPDQILVDHASSLHPGDALDLGCGPGRNAVWLARQGWHVTGVDASAVGLSQVRERATMFNVSIETVQADLLTYVPSEGGFDLVVVANIHLAEPMRTQLFDRAARALKIEGNLFVVGHHLRDLGRHGPPDQERLYSVDRLRNSFPSLAVERLEEYERFAGPGEAPLTDVVVWARRTA
jgi:SAM-dependent methyltransferase